MAGEPLRGDVDPGVGFGEGGRSKSSIGHSAETAHKRMRWSGGSAFSPREGLRNEWDEPCPNTLPSFDSERKDAPAAIFLIST